jgi:hypothetical protein
MRRERRGTVGVAAGQGGQARAVDTPERGSKAARDVPWADQRPADGRTT